MIPETLNTTNSLTFQQAAAFSTLEPFLLGKSTASMAVLRGYAGTGKTFTVGRLIQSLQASGIRIAVAAPTNKAVRVLREKIAEAGVAVPDAPLESFTAEGRARTQSDWLSFGSIHSLLGLQLTERDDGTQECRSAREPSLHEYDAVVIDECSMIGEDLFRRIVVAKRQTRILFVGDPAQLPPVEAGELVSPTFEKVSLQLALSEVVRQAVDNPIIKLSMMIRQAIEDGRRLDALAIAEALPPLNTHPSAAIVAGNGNTVVNFALAEIRAGRDARVLAFTNGAVMTYNRAIHTALHGDTAHAFSVGEPVIVHAQCDAKQCAGGRLNGMTTTLITSEEAKVAAVNEKAHPLYPQIPSYQLILERDGFERVAVYVPDDMQAMERGVAEQFSEWRRLKALADEPWISSDAALQYKAEAKAASTTAWAMRKAFAPLRHAYALTAHKSQGSTFDTAIVDLADLNRMKSAFAFNRGLYVCATRPSQYLAIVA